MEESHSCTGYGLFVCCSANYFSFHCKYVLQYLLYVIGLSSILFHLYFNSLRVCFDAPQNHDASWFYFFCPPKFQVMILWYSGVWSCNEISCKPWNHEIKYFFWMGNCNFMFLCHCHLTFFPYLKLLFLTNKDLLKINSISIFEI